MVASAADNIQNDEWKNCPCLVREVVARRDSKSGARVERARGRGWLEDGRQIASAGSNASVPVSSATIEIAAVQETQQGARRMMKTCATSRDARAGTCEMAISPHHRSDTEGQGAPGSVRKLTGMRRTL